MADGVNIRASRWERAAFLNGFWTNPTAPAARRRLVVSSVLNPEEMSTLT